MKQLFQEKLSTNPHFYITYGPPASGKTSIMSKVLETSGKNKATVVEVNIDDIVRNYEAYQGKRHGLHETYSSNPDLLKSKYQELYWSCRRAFADEASDTLLDKALLRRHDIVWETNGKSIAWTVKEAARIRKLGYEIILVYPYVERSTLIHRANSRINQESPPASEIIQAADLAQKHLPKLINYVDRVYIFDNNGELGHPKLLLEISHEYLGTNYCHQDHPRHEKSRYVKQLDDSEYSGHVYVVDCHVQCDEDSVLIARDDGQEQHLIDMINHYCTCDNS